MARKGNGGKDEYLVTLACCCFNSAVMVQVKYVKHGASLERKAKSKDCTVNRKTNLL